MTDIQVEIQFLYDDVPLKLMFPFLSQLFSFFFFLLSILIRSALKFPNHTQKLNLTDQ